MATFIPSGGSSGASLTSGQIGIGDNNNQLSGSADLTSDGQGVFLNGTALGAHQTILSLRYAGNTGGVPDALVQGLNVLNINGAKLKFQVGGGTGNAGQVMTADGAGYAAWANPSGGGGTETITALRAGAKPFPLASAPGGSPLAEYYTQIGHDMFGSYTSSSTIPTIYNDVAYMSPFYNLDSTDRNPNYWKWQFSMWDTGNALDNNVGITAGIYEDTSGDGWPDTLLCTQALNISTGGTSSGQTVVELSSNWIGTNGSAFTGTLTARKQYWLAHMTWGNNYARLRYRYLSGHPYPDSALANWLNGAFWSNQTIGNAASGMNQMPVINTTGSSFVFTPQDARALFPTSLAESNFSYKSYTTAGRNKIIWMRWP